MFEVAFKDPDGAAWGFSAPTVGELMLVMASLMPVYLKPDMSNDMANAAADVFAAAPNNWFTSVPSKVATLRLSPLDEGP